MKKKCKNSALHESRTSGTAPLKQRRTLLTLKSLLRCLAEVHCVVHPRQESINVTFYIFIHFYLLLFYCLIKFYFRNPVLAHLQLCVSYAAMAMLRLQLRLKGLNVKYVG